MAIFAVQQLLPDMLPHFQALEKSLAACLQLRVGTIRLSSCGVGHPFDVAILVHNVLDIRVAETLNRAETFLDGAFVGFRWLKELLIGLAVRTAVTLDEVVLHQVMELLIPQNLKMP